MTLTSRRLTVTLHHDERAALKTIERHIGTPSASAAMRVALIEHAAALESKHERASRLPSVAT